MRLALFLIALPTVAIAADKMSDAISSLQTGVICPPPSVGETLAPGTLAGTTHLIRDDPPFVSLGNRVPAVIGIGFGSKAMATTLEGLDNITITVTHPPMGASGVTTQTFQSSISGIDTSLTFYQFDYEYELLIGTWELEAQYQGELLYRTTFEIVPPQDIPEIATICRFEELLS